MAGRCASSVGHIPSNDGNEGWLHLQCQHGWNSRAASDGTGNAHWMPQSGCAGKLVDWMGFCPACSIDAH